MQRLFIILIIIFILIMVVSAFMLNIMKQDITRTYQIKKETAKSEVPSKKNSRPVSLEESETPKEIPEERVKEGLNPEKEPEYNLDDIPIEEAKAVESKVEEEAPEEGGAPQKRLNTQPPIDKLRELRVKGAVIY